MDIFTLLKPETDTKRDGNRTEGRSFDDEEVI